MIKNYLKIALRNLQRHKMYSILNIAGLAVGIACINFMNLATARSAKHAREVGLRKVVGASITKITIMLCKEFILLVLLANIIAWPVAFWPCRTGS